MVNVPIPGKIINSSISGIISGGIIMFDGSFGGPDNKHPIDRATGEPDLSYVICDGTVYTLPDGTEVTTPDMSDKFIIGASETHPINTTGGSLNQPLSGTVGDTTLTVNQMPSHVHYPPVGSSGSNWNKCGSGSNSGGFTAHPSTATGGSLSHTHDLVTAEISFLPPYYALCFIKKL